MGVQSLWPPGQGWTRPGLPVASPALQHPARPQEAASYQLCWKGAHSPASILWSEPRAHQLLRVPLQVGSGQKAPQGLCRARGPQSCRWGGHLDRPHVLTASPPPALSEIVLFNKP